ncbi:hypothetical protein PV08_03569 [Exophiala spinifera]|uniref:Uncharacterized protein n=1 Tax=Exophiala spinifera TaxID=91928 RepID=A0A0D2BKZ4_9EURO|nr:uncharacterized protein PV08_03569 [Exophiala spinifera]KIW19275.1 hypothetical protein PV08_03569 [Exophiala spinifera]
MRLHLHILRNALPPVQIIFTTGTGPLSHTRDKDCTVADLLADINVIVPLESSDGEWGLEDYVVEVAPALSPSTALVSYGGGSGRDRVLRGQTHGGPGGYECLHYATIEAVLREDDEVTIRPLSSDELRLRRLGGRHQITGDGRHLVDGVAFGKRWLRAGTSRPGILIPPRKRRRMLPAEDEDGEEDIKQILPRNWDTHDHNSGTLVRFTEDDEDDDDYDDSSYEESDDDQLEPDEQPDFDEVGDKDRLQIALREEFDDADVDPESAEEDELQDWNQDVEEHDESLLTDNDDLSEEVKLLLKDAEYVAQAGGGRASRKVLERTLKRKRDVADDGDRYDGDIFEGFSTPQKGSKQKPIGTECYTDGVTSSSGSDTSPSDFEGPDTETRSSPVLPPEPDEADTSSEFESTISSSDSDDDSGSEDVVMEEAKKRALALMNGFGNEASNKPRENASSTETKGKEQEDAGSSDDDDMSSSEEDSSEASSSDSEADTDSGSEASDLESQKDRNVVAGRPTLVSSKPAPPIETPPFKPIQLSEKRPAVAPGQGLSRTHRNNERMKKKKKLALLKSSGVLPPEADFRALTEYEDAQNKPSEQGRIDAAAPETPAAGIETAIEDVERTMTVEAGRNAVSLDDTAEAEEVAREPTTDTPKSMTHEPELTAQSASKRARLDLASSRRMLFSSLGLRTPKTKEAEQALREKLSKPVRPAAQATSSTNEASPSSQTRIEDWDIWRDKLVVSAVECEGEGGTLDPPPFPFQQGWMRRNGTNKKRKMRDQEQYYQATNDLSQDYDKGAKNSDASALNYDDDQNQTSIEPSHESETPDQTSAKAIPDVENLPTLQKEDAVPGATIAYKELHVDASTNWQPEISSYRVGEISHADPDGTIRLQLDPSSQKIASRTAVNDQGQTTHGFEITDDEPEEADDGSREIQFSDLISPKLVKASSIEVPESSHRKRVGLHGGDSTDECFAVVPESAEREVDNQESEAPHITVEIDTPRRQEITAMIRDAGFDSALDEQLLHPVSNIERQLRRSQSPARESSRVHGEDFHDLHSRSPRLDLGPSGNPRSSLLGGESSPPLTDNANPSSEIGDEPISSSPFIHTQETVEYPHISQMNISSSGRAPKNDSSSHQDAQKLSPAPALELSFDSFESNRGESAVSAAVTASEEAYVDDDYEPSVHVEEPVANGHDAVDSDTSAEKSGSSTRSSAPNSEVPQSQSQSQSQSQPQQESFERQDSFLGGTGYDGHDSSYHDDSDAYSSDDLPSLSEITSSQLSRRGPPAKTTRSSIKKFSRVQTRTSLRNATTNGSPKNKSPTPLSSPAPDLPPSSQAEFKLSQSQEPRMSQIPSGTPIVDLTVSSGVSSPAQSQGQGDNDDHRDDHEEHVKSKSEESVNGHRYANGQSQGVSKTSRKPSVSGVGTRRLLTTKKRNYF